MDPASKRRVRLVVALTAALVLAGGLVYTSFSAGSPAKTPSELIAQTIPGESYKLTGKVVDGSIKRDGDVLHFEVRDREGTAAVPVAYTGTVPDPFREGREIIITVKQSAGSDGYTGEKDSLITKCPSKFEAEDSASGMT